MFWITGDVVILLWNEQNVLNMLYSKKYQGIKNKKAFQSNANRPLSDSPFFMVNKFEPVRGGRSVTRACTVSSKLNDFEHVLLPSVEEGGAIVMYRNLPH